MDESIEEDNPREYIKTQIENAESDEEKEMWRKALKVYEPIDEDLKKEEEIKKDLDFKYPDMRGYLVIDDIPLKEAKALMKVYKNKKGRWLSGSGMGKNDSAASFAIVTHGFPKIEKDEIHRFK